MGRGGPGRAVRWRDGVQPGRQADRQDLTAGALCQSLLRRRAAQSPVHGGEPLALFALYECARLALRGALLRLEIGGADQLCPFLALGAQLSGEIVGRAADRIEAERGEALL